MQKLKLSDVIALGFMTFALFLGAGNIIFPPLVGLLAGDDMGPAAIGFLLTGVGLPLVTIVALARVGGGLDALTAPVGRVAGVVFAILVYLSIGPLFAAPRTAVVSFEIGLAPFVGEGPLALFLYSLVYFAVVLWITLNPSRLIDNVGKVITPVLILALVVLGATAVFMPAGEITEGSPVYDDTPLIQGFLQGYQTMDALAALVFGIVVVNAIRGRGVTDRGLQARYAISAAAIAAVGLALVYLSLIYMGASSGGLQPGAQTGVPLLASFTGYAFGAAGTWVLAIVIVLACLTTAVGVLTACGQYFSVLLKVTYARLVIVFCLFSMAVANIGLEQLIAVSVPVLVALYPVSITLVLLSLCSRLWRRPSRVFMLPMAMAAVFGAAESLKMFGLEGWLPQWVALIPGADLGLGWVVPVIFGVAVGVLFDRFGPTMPHSVSTRKDV